MIVIADALIGAVLGGLTARKLGGAMADIAQYAASFGIAFAFAGMIAAVIIHRLAV